MLCMNLKQADLTRAKLLRAAFCEIHRHGYQAASIANILVDTGLTKGALYHHFDTKKALGLAVIDEVIREQFDEQIFAPLRRSAHPVETLLRIIDTIDQDQAADFILLGCPLNNLMQEMSSLCDTFKDRLNAVLMLWKDSLEDVFKRGQQQGVIRAEVDCQAVALFVVSAWEGCAGTAKNFQSADAFRGCMQQLHGFISSLQVAAKPAKRKAA